MDPWVLATTAMAALAPFLGWAAEQLGDKTSQTLRGETEKARLLYSAIKRRVSVQAAGAHQLQRLEADPGNKVQQRVVASTLAEILDHDLEFADQVLELVEQTQASDELRSDRLERCATVTGGTVVVPPEVDRVGGDGWVATGGDEYQTPADDPGSGSEPPIEVRDVGSPDLPVAGADPVQVPRRYLEGRVPERVRRGDTVGLQVRVALTAGAEGATVPLALRVPNEGIELRITAHVPGFELRGSQLQPLRVPADGDSSWVLFELHAVREGVHDLIVAAYHPEGRQLGELTMQVVIDAAATTGASSDARAPVSSFDGLPGEITLIVDWLEDRDVYRFQLIDPSFPEEVETTRLARTPKAIVESLVADLNALATGRLRPTTQVRSWIRDKGVELWSELIPQQLQNQFWERRDRISSLSIVARRDPIPWELLYPLARGHDAGFLVEQFPVLRWIRGVSPVERIGAGALATVLPAVGSPSSASTEVALVRELWKARSGGASAGDMMALRLLLELGEFGALHFACHNTFDPDGAGGTQVRFGRDAFTPSVLAPMIATGAFESGRPLVFMNACRSASQAPLYTELGGWASGFIRAGAAAFVGSLWAVRDSSAKVFAETFYRRMLADSTLGEATSAARAALDGVTDPTWLAYTVYGNPRTKLAGVAS